ncbi:MAG: bifunctional oligoribonuclease/PAP phosphatase NrnA [Clostridiaceae bacterium]|nr:bifunctional oligoribonuclease/PAP phosphatase NrnA [Clostridiaceae bacterium]
MKELIDLINKASSIVILTHYSLDGDALGSSLGLALALDYIGKEVTVFIEESIPKSLEFLPGQDLISSDMGKNADLAISLDNSDLKRLGNGAEIYARAKKKINIDHHTTNSMEADSLWIDQNASATGEMVYKLIKAMDIPISKDIAVCLYTAIITDTGGFRYSNTTPDSHIIAAELINCGIPFARIAKKVFDIVSHSKMSLLKKTIQNLTLYFDGKVAVSWLLYDDIYPVNAQSDDYEGLVNVGINLEGVEVSLFIREEEPGRFKGSLRANDYVDVAKIAGKFSGGGHIRAAGFNASGNMDDIIMRVLDEIKKEL